MRLANHVCKPTGVVDCLEDENGLCAAKRNIGVTTRRTNQRLITPGHCLKSDYDYQAMAKARRRINALLRRVS